MKDSKTKDIPFQTADIESIDTALINYIKSLNLSCTTNKGFQLVPIIWSTSERAYITKISKDRQDSEGAINLPIIAIERASVSKDPKSKGSAFGNIPPIDSPKGGSITIARRIKQDKTANFTNAETKKHFGQINFPTKKIRKIVYETITIAMPVYIDVLYKVRIKTNYQEQMNSIVQPFITKPGGINYIIIENEGHRYEGRIQGDFEQNNNSDSMGADERSFETVISIKVLGHLIGDGVNSSQPKISIRENAVDLKMPKEHIIFGDIADYFKKGTGIGRYVGIGGFSSYSGSLK